MTRRRFFEELRPFADAIGKLTPANVKHTVHNDREALIAAQRKRMAKQERRLKREGKAP
jgi:hypothetical protein